MEITVDVVGDETRTVEVPEGATYADLVAPLDVSVHEVSVMVDDRTVPEDQPIAHDVDTVRVVRLVQGG
jgi:sulfur carrier protein